MSKTPYAGWPNCIKLSNGKIDVVVTTDIGPRIIFCGFAGEENLFWNDPETLGKTGGDEWTLYGGHRLWHSPEVMPRTYSPDNKPIKTKEVGGYLRTLQPVEPGTGIEKEMDIRVIADENAVEIVHRVHNAGPWEIELAAWSLSVMAPGGIGICPQPTSFDPQGFLPNRSLILWPYTKMSDPRMTWGDKYLTMRQDAKKADRLKFGINNDDGWLAYLRGEYLFVKTFEYQAEGDYPDGGCSIELFTNENMLEVETLSPLTFLAPGDELEHVEVWRLFKGLDCDGSEKCIDKCVLPLVEETL
jgi:hypothetical protein